MPLTFPTSVCPRLANEPYNCVLYGGPGVGKTPAAAVLPDHALWDLQFNLGSKYVDCRRVVPTDDAGLPRAFETWREFVDMLEVARTVQPKPRFQIFDPLSRIAEWAEDKATEWYKKVPLGANFTGGSVLELKGKDANSGSPGWMYLWDHFKQLLKWTYATAETRTIYIGHYRDAMLTNPGAKGAKLGTEVDEKDLDLPGKMRNIFIAEMDLAGYFYRNANGVLMLTFQSRKQNQFVKCRCPHLLGRSFEFHTPATVDDWRQIYPDSLALKEMITVPEGAPATSTPATT